MTGYIVGIIIALGLILVVLWKLNIFPFKKKYVYRTDHLPVNFPEYFSAYKFTPEGANCNFEDPISEEQWETIAPIIDMGIRNCVKGFPAEWTKKRTAGEYLIAFIKPTATNMDGSPALLVGGVQSAGTVLGVGTASFSPPTIVLPQQKDWEHLSYLMHSVWNEGEHFAEWANDQGAFWQYVGAGDVHPHRPIENPEMPPAPMGLVGKAKSQFKCGVS